MFDEKGKGWALEVSLASVLGLEQFADGYSETTWPDLSSARSICETKTLLTHR